MRGLGFAAGALILAALVAGCGGSTSGLLDDLRLVPSSAESLDRVDLAGIGDEVLLANADLWMLHDGGEVPVPILVDDDGPYFVAPLHPATPGQGGRVELIMEYGEERSQQLGLEVTPLPAAPGAWDETVAHLREAIAYRAEQNGLTFEQLQGAAITDLPPDLAPLKLAQVYVDDGSDTDLMSLMVSPAFGFSQQDKVMIDALVAKLDLRAYIGEIPRVNMFRGASAIPSAAPSLAPPRPFAGGLACRAAGIQVADASDLSAKMHAAIDSQILEGGAEQKVLNDIGSVTTVGGFVPVIGWLTSGVGALFTAGEAYKNGVAGLYPSHLQSMTAEIGGDTFREDFIIGHGWYDVKVTATSTGWTADADAAKTVLSVASTAGTFAAGTKVAGMSNAEGFAVDTSQALRDSAANALIEEHSNLLRFCPESWTVDITGEPWSTGRAVLRRLAVDSTVRVFEPIETSLELPVDDTLRIEANPQAFPRQSVHIDFPITVVPIIVSGPRELIVNELGSTIDVVITIRNAHDFESLSWESTEGAFTGSARLSEGGASGVATWTRSHATPSSSSDYPYVITVESTSSSGLRADGHPRRLHQIIVRAAEIVVEPSSATVGVGESHQFTASHRNGQAVAVNWTATGGTISSTGLYTAGRTPGAYEVTATSTQDPSRSGTSTVTVVEIECPIGQWEILNLEEFMDQRFAAAGGAATGIDLAFGGGTYFVTLNKGGTFLEQRVLTVLGSTAEGTSVSTIDARDTGTWSYDEDAGTFSMVGGTTTGTVSVVVTSGGQEFSIVTDIEEYDGLSGTGRYECSGSNLIITFGAFRTVMGPGSPP